MKRVLVKRQGAMFSSYLAEEQVRKEGGPMKIFGEIVALPLN